MVAIVKCAHLAFLCVTLVLNGQAVAVSRQSVKVLVDPVTQAEQDVRNTALAAQLSDT